jgi:hypothetical protein
MNLKDYKKIILHKLSTILKPRKFRKTGNIFSYSNGDLTYFINLQSSQSSTDDTLKMTINIEIASTTLIKLEDISIPEKHRRHYTQRIGSLLDQPHDKWWTIDSSETALRSSVEIEELIVTKVFPMLDNLQTTTDLVNLWRQGKFIGLTQKAGEKYLQLLESDS